MSADAMTSGWYYAKAGAPVGQEIGPLSWQELYLLAQGGSLAPSDLVWNPRLPRGVTAALVPGLFPSPATPEPPQAQTTAPVPPVEQIPAEPPAAPAASEAPSVEIPVTLAESVDSPPTEAPQAATAGLPPEPAPQPPPETDTPQATEETSPEEAESQGLSAETSEPISEAEPAKDEPTPSPKKSGHTNLPWLIVLLAAAIAAAGLAAYFIYLRDFWV